MTTVAQVRQVVQPLLHRNPDLAMIGRLVVIKPVQHILRGIYIDRIGVPRLFMPAWAVVFLFEPRQSFSYNWGERIGRPVPGAASWDANDPGTPAMMCEAIEKGALSLLRPIKTIDDFAKFTSKERFPHTFLDLYKIRKIFVDVARGDLDTARSICDYLASDKGKLGHLPMMQQEYDRVTKELCPLVAANDRTGLARLLHSYEAQSVRNLKLEKFWERTPFPIELSDAVS